MQFYITTDDGGFVTEVEDVEIQEVDLEVDTFPEYITSGEVEISITIPMAKADLVQYFKYRNDYIKKELFSEGDL